MTTRAWLLCTAIPLVIFAVILALLATHKDYGPLTFQETVGLAFVHHNWPANLSHNPHLLDSQAALFLRQSYTGIGTRQRRGFLLVVGLLGDSIEDVTFMEQRIIDAGQYITRTSPGTADVSEWTSNGLALEEGVRGLERMAQREVPSAIERLQDMCAVQYWDERGVRMEADIPSVPYQGLLVAARALERLDVAGYDNAIETVRCALQDAGMRLSDEESERLHQILEEYIASEHWLKNLYWKIFSGEPKPPSIYDRDYRQFLHRRCAEIPGLIEYYDADQLASSKPHLLANQRGRHERTPVFPPRFLHNAANTISSTHADQVAILKLSTLPVRRSLRGIIHQ